MLDVVNRAVDIFVESTAISTIALLTILPFCKHPVRSCLIQQTDSPHYGVKYLPTWLPGLKFYRNAPVSRDLARKMLDTPFEFVKKSIVCSQDRHASLVLI